MKLVKKHRKLIVVVVLTIAVVSAVRNYMGLARGPAGETMYQLALLGIVDPQGQKAIIDPARDFRFEEAAFVQANKNKPKHDHGHEHGHEHGHDHGHDHAHEHKPFVNESLPEQAQPAAKQTVTTTTTPQPPSIILNNLSGQSNASASQANNAAAKRKRFYAHDGNGGFFTDHVTKCGDELEVELVSGPDKADFSFYVMDLPAGATRSSPSKRNNNGNRYYTMVYALESEPHSSSGDSWSQADFRMWYNLDDSFPEPATYFDVRSYLATMLSPPLVDFDKKEASAPLVWVLSNCGAFNARQEYIKELMKLAKVDSYGRCLQNKHTHTHEHMKGNVELFSTYKFAIAIENSNCRDYVTEKLVHAVASGSIPVVAGRDSKPDYARYLPKNTYLNVYDFKSVAAFADKVREIGDSRQLYDKYTYFKRAHNYTRDQLHAMTLPQLIEVARRVIDPVENAAFFDGIVGKEKSESKLCKVARTIRDTPEQELDKLIEARRMRRPKIGEACLAPGNLDSDF